MGRNQKYDFTLSNGLVVTAKHLLDFKEKHNYIDHKLAAICTRAAAELYPGRNIRIHRSRINRILACADHSHSDGTFAKVLQKHETPVFCHVLGLTPAELTGLDDPPPIIVADAFGDPNRAHQFYEALSEHQPRAAELVGWAEFLPCSLETEDFMHEHHQSIFADQFDSREQLDEVVARYDAIGNPRRKAILNAGPNRHWTFTHIMMQSHLEKLALPKNKASEYCECGVDSRRACLQGLSFFIRDPSWKINLLIVKDKDAQKTRRRLPGIDSQVVLLDKNGKGLFAFWRYGDGTLSWTIDPTTVARKHRCVETFRNVAAWRSDVDCQGVLDFLARLQERLSQW